MKVNYHTHTTWCDGMDSAETMVKAAIDRGFEVLGFSAHGDMLSSPLAYIREIRSLSAKYREQIKILCGIEAEEGDTLGLKDKLDYAIGSLHYVRSQDGAKVAVDHTAQLLSSGIAEHFGGDEEMFVKEYYRQQRAMIERGGFEILGHPDLIHKFGLLDHVDAKREEALTADLVAAKNLMVELNTGAIARGYLDEAYPFPAFRALFRERGVKFVISSDAHSAAALDCAFDRDWQLTFNAL